MIVLVQNSFGAGGVAAPYGSHIGWRLDWDTNMGAAGRTSLSEIQFLDALGAVITATGGTAFEGGSGTVNAPASAAFDGNTSSGRWSRLSNVNTIIGYLYPAAKSVASVKMYSADWDAAGQTEAPLKGRLRYSDDTTNGIDGTWTTAFEIWEPSWFVGAQCSRTWPQDFTGGKYKAYVWFPTLSNDGAHMAMDEAELFIGGGSVDQIDSSNSRGYASAGVSNPGNLIDNSTANWTELGATNRFCGVALPAPIGVVTGYSLGKYQWLTEAWKNWTFKGTNDGVTFSAALDTQVNQTWASASKKSYGPF